MLLAPFRRGSSFARVNLGQRRPLRPPPHEHSLTEQLANRLLTFAAEATKSNRHSDNQFSSTEVSLEAMSWVAFGIFVILMLGIAALATWLVYEISTP